MSRKDRSTWLLEELTSIMREEGKLEEHAARDLAAAVARGLTKHHGGLNLYVPARSNFERDESIRRDFNGRNCHELMVRWDVSRTTIYRIVK